MRKIFLSLVVAATIFVSCNSNNTSNSKPLVVAAADAAEKYQCPMKYITLIIYSVMHQQNTFQNFEVAIPPK
jgi:hypothetical protein